MIALVYLATVIACAASAGVSRTNAKSRARSGIRCDTTPIDGESATYLNALRGSTYWYDGAHSASANPIDWVICGGESGPGARPMNAAWAQSLRDQCASAGVPFFFKQWGEWAPAIDAPFELQRWGKKAAGRLLDGLMHDAFPVARVEQEQ